MAEGAGRSLITCPEDYLKSLKSFYASLALEQETYSKTPTSKCVEEHATSLIKEYVCDLLEDHSPFCILSVGSGKGSSDLSFIEILSKVRQERLEQKKNHDLKFDVVHFFHSLYYAGLEAALEHCYEKELGAKGEILCFINDEQSTMSNSPVS